MYVTEAKTFMHGITLLSNSVTGPVSGEGGALSAVNGELRLNRCEFRQNSAETGGGLLLRGSLLGEIQASRIELNYVRGMGGGAVLQGGVSLHLANVHMLGNRALLISDILAAGSGILLSIFNSTFESKALLIGLVQGALVQLHNSSVWVSRVPGAAFVPDLAGSESSEIIRFEVCPSGSYLLSESSSVNRVGCSSCPTGAYCAGGTSVYARRSHWGWLSVTSELTMARCPEGYCCANTTCSPYNFCRGNRAGFLCGVCADGYSEVLGSPGCQKDDDCTHFRWLLPVLLLISGVFVFVVLFLSKRRVQAIYKTRHEGSLVQDNGGEHKVIVFFFQCLPLVVSAESLETQSQFTQVLLSVFNLNFSNGVAGQTENSGWCPFIGFSVAQKITSRFIFPGLCLGWLVVFLFVEKVLMRFHTHDDQQYCGFGAHVAAFFVVFGVAYSSLVQATFDLVDCAALPGRLVWFPSAGVECFQSWQFLVLGTAVPILALWPTFLVSVVHRVQRVAKQRQTTHVGGEAVLQQLSRPYDRSRQVSLQWESVLMLQRLVLVTVSVFIVDANWRPWTLIVLLTVMLAVQTAVQPFARQGSNLYFSGCYCVLLALASWEMGLAVSRDRGWPSPTQEFRPVLGMFTLTPLCIGCLLAAQQPLMSLRSSLFKSAPSFFRAKPSAAVEFGTLGALIDGAEDLERVANAEQVVVVNWLGEQWEPEETDGAVAC